MPSVGQWIFIGIGSVIALFVIFLFVLYMMKTSYKCDNEAANLAIEYYHKNNPQKMIPSYLDIKPFLEGSKDDENKMCDVRFRITPGPGSRMKVSGMDHRRFTFDLNKDGDWYVSKMGDYHSGTKFE